MVKYFLSFLFVTICISITITTGIPTPTQETNHFNRPCSTSPDCEFQNGIVRDTVYLSCENKVCSCDRFRYIADVPAWDLQWNPQTQECKIALSGPCGTSKGLKISCQAGLECLEGRCRDVGQLRKNPLNYSCNENIDCQEGFACKVTSFSFSAQKTCVTPETKVLEGFEDY